MALSIVIVSLIAFLVLLYKAVRKANHSRALSQLSPLDIAKKDFCDTAAAVKCLTGDEWYQLNNGSYMRLTAITTGYVAEYTISPFVWPPIAEGKVSITVLVVDTGLSDVPYWTVENVAVEQQCNEIPVVASAFMLENGAVQGLRDHDKIHDLMSSDRLSIWVRRLRAYARQSQG